ncbi:P-loop containing nucleoside triphosphate hydrolase protein [Polychytrium aggregatum]|uniref:P-loop containing nucleoside triphosphate hydrolase protein n=1 Tax=Polychytrium aggregatum TaxID=110093 RepID=UPI0022FE3D95|nr:P-loop containing nucleoside triphosphate hydrolase protein [Polychytrium aggregatum]KAI9202343.1 P-loop containing nucleoside triphosphate hydrolase protein [Polychytrium aggregatum]
MSTTNKVVLKIVIIGDGGVGKTSLRNQFIHSRFTHAYKATIGADFITKDIDVDGKSVHIQIWDTAGQERFQSLGTAFYRGTDACILVYDVTSASSFNNLARWIPEFLKYANISDPTRFPFLLVANKVDCDPVARAVSKQQGCDMARTLKRLCEEEHRRWMALASPYGNLSSSVARKPSLRGRGDTYSAKTGLSDPPSLVSPRLRPEGNLRKRGSLQSFLGDRPPTPLYPPAQSVVPPSSESGSLLWSVVRPILGNSSKPSSVQTIPMKSTREHDLAQKHSVASIQSNSTYMTALDQFETSSSAPWDPSRRRSIDSNASCELDDGDIDLARTSVRRKPSLGSDVLLEEPPINTSFYHPPTLPSVNVMRTPSFSKQRGPLGKKSTQRSGLGNGSTSVPAVSMLPPPTLPIPQRQQPGIRSVSPEPVAAPPSVFAPSEPLPFFEASAKTGEQVEDIFVFLARHVALPAEAFDMTVSETIRIEEAIAPRWNQSCNC